MIYGSNPEPSGVGSLLSEPSEDPVTFDRARATYENHSDRFLLKQKSFSRQYAHVYTARLWRMRPKVEAAAKKKWGEDIPVRKLFQLEHDERCIVVGTLFKQMDLKPCILKEISEDHNLMPQPARAKYVEEADKLILEDELQRIVLVGNIDVQSSITGVTLALFGKEPDEDRGKFHVEEYCFCDLAEQVPRPVVEKDRFVCLVSGLDLGSKGEDPMSLQLMVDLLTGQLGDECQQESTAEIVRLIIAGNSLSAETQDKESFNKAKYLTKKTAAGSVEAMKALDDVLVQLAASMDVDLMPGEQDPANHALPQQALHRCMFPQAMVYPTTSCVSNPYDCSIDGVRFLGTSGQPVSDMYRYSDMEDHLKMLEDTLRWCHLAPTAPDTLGCYPYSDHDPFILEECPHVYFAGNMPKFQQSMFEGSAGQRVRVIAVPRFSQTSTCVLVNLKTLECQLLNFEASFPAAEPQQESPDVDK